VFLGLFICDRAPSQCLKRNLGEASLAIILARFLLREQIMLVWRKLNWLFINKIPQRRIIETAIKGASCFVGTFVGTNDRMAEVKIQVFGKVQGVFFRHSARQQAQSLHLTGWIKNLADGSVLCEAAGERNALLKFLEWCKRGPEKAEVKNVDVQWLEDGNLPRGEGFSIVD
jgi:acylphosphatase